METIGMVHLSDISPRSSAFVNWILVGFYETDRHFLDLSYRKTISFFIRFDTHHTILFFNERYGIREFSVDKCGCSVGG